MKVTLAQVDLIWEDREANFRKLKHFLEKAINEESDLVIFPEMSLSGFTMEPEKVFTTEEDLERLKGFSKKATFGVGIVEKENDEFYNTYILLKGGNVLCKYRKIHLFSLASEDKYYTSGREIVNCEINGVRITPFICYDLRFPCAFRKVVEKTDVFVIGANWPEKRIEHWKTLLKARAIENLTYVIGVNRVGRDPFHTYPGHSGVVDPWGEILMEAGREEGLYTIEINVSKVKRVRNGFPTLKDRKFIP